MTFFSWVRKEPYGKRTSYLTEVDKEQQWDNAFTSLHRRNYVNDSSRLTSLGKAAVSFYLPRFTEREELVDILDQVSDDRPIFSLVDYVTSFCSCIIGHEFVHSPFYHHLYDHESAFNQMLEQKELPLFEFRTMIALYFLELAEEQQLVSIVDGLFRKNYTERY